MKKILKFLALLLPLLLAVGIEFPIAIIGILVYYSAFFTADILQNGFVLDQYASPADLLSRIPYPSDAFMNWCQYASQIMWAIVFFFWYQALVKNEPRTRIKLFTPKNIIMIALVSAGFQLSTGGLLELILPHFEKLAKQYEELMEMISTGNPIFSFLSVVVLAPISEELVFRGVIMTKARKIAPFLVANIIQALLFGIFHMNLVQGVYAFAGGLAMGYVAYKFKTIWASIVLHFFFNGFSYLIYSPSSEYILVAYVMVGIVLMTVALLQIRKVGVKQADPADAFL